MKKSMQKFVTVWLFRAKTDTSVILAKHAEIKSLELARPKILIL